MSDTIITIVISVITALGTSVLLGFMNRFGKLKIYYKIPIGHSYSNDDCSKYFLHFPLDVFIEIQNTTRKTRMVRDFNAFLVKDNNIIAIFVQGSGSTTKKRDGTVEAVEYGNKRSYSFSSAPRTITQYKLCFAQPEACAIIADKLVFRYFNEKDKGIYLHGCYIESDHSKCKAVLSRYLLLKKCKRPTNAGDF